MREIEDGMGFSGYGKPSYEERLEIENGKLQKKLETARRNEQKMREAFNSVRDCALELLKEISEINQKKRKELGLKEGEFVISGNFAYNRACYDLDAKCRLAKQALDKLEEW